MFRQLAISPNNNLVRRSLPRYLGTSSLAHQILRDESPSKSTQLGFLGGGSMASAMMTGIDKNGVIPFADMGVYDPHRPCVDRFVAKGGFGYNSAEELVKQSDTVCLAVKPNVLMSVLDEVADVVDESKLIISVAAGVTTETIERKLPRGTRVIRVMPNTPCLVGSGASGFTRGKHATDMDVEYVGSVLDCLGRSVNVEEKDMHAVTGVSGSGPAYIFLLIEALADGAVRKGLQRDVALELAAQTVKGAAEMVLETNMHPGQLKDQVCSPNGTTIAAVEALEMNGFRKAAISAVVAAANRSEELAKM